MIPRCNPSGRPLSATEATSTSNPANLSPNESTGEHSSGGASLTIIAVIVAAVVIVALVAVIAWIVVRKKGGSGEEDQRTFENPVYQDAQSSTQTSGYMDVPGHTEQSNGYLDVQSAELDDGLQDV